MPSGPSRRGDREELAPLVQERREEDHEQDLGDLARLERERPEPHPDARPVDRAADSGDERQQQEREADEAGGVAEPVQDPVVRQQHQDGHERRDPDEDPHPLIRRLRGVETHDHRVPDPDEETGHGQEDRRRVGGEAPDREVQADEQRRRERHERPRVRGDVGESAALTSTGTAADSAIAPTSRASSRLRLRLARVAGALTAGSAPVSAPRAARWPPPVGPSSWRSRQSSSSMRSWRWSAPATRALRRSVRPPHGCRP